MKNQKKFFTALFFILISYTSLLSQDTLRLIGGETKLVYFTETNTQFVSYYLYKDKSRKEYTIPVELLEEIAMKDGSQPKLKRNKRYETYNLERPEKKVRNAIFMEFLGPGGFGSINYDLSFKVQENIELGGRVGYGLSGFLLSFTSYSIVEGHIAWKKNNNRLLVGLGNVSSNSSGIFERELHTNGLLIDIGYRYMAPRQGFFFQASLTPVLYGNSNFATIPVGLSLGFAF